MPASAQPDWTALARSPEFRALTASRRRFLVAGTVFYTGYFVAFLCLLGFAPHTMSDRVFGSVTLALVLGMSLVLLAWVMAFLHARKSGEWDRLAQRVVDRASSDEARFSKAHESEGSVR
jgi:uncharacterized membrane protein (DUF485 family)